MVKKESESFKEYTQHWRDLAVQVALPMVEREMINMMVGTLPVFYYEKLVGYMPSRFADLVFTGERIELSLKRGKFDYVSSTGTNVMQSYPARALGRRLQVYWARDPREGPRVLMSLRVDFEPMG